MSAKKDLTGKRFGKLVVLEDAGRNKKQSVIWKCECDCGSLTTSSTYNLTSGHKKSCGCIRTGPQPEDLVGKMFGRLMVEKYVKTDKWRTTHWSCKCRCGNYTIVSRSALLNGTTKSCGCLLKELGAEKLKTWRKHQPKMSKEELAYNKKIYNILRKYGLTEDEYKNILSKQNNKCAVCGSDSKLVIDHDHNTGKVRGILCYLCNVGLGSFRDNIKYLKQAIEFLEESNV